MKSYHVHSCPVLSCRVISKPVSDSNCNDLGQADDKAAMGGKDDEYQPRMASSSFS